MAARNRQEERREETRAELIAAAAKVFAERGFAAASIDEIAKEAGYTSGAIYWHFKGKEDLFFAVYEHYAASRAREIADVFAREDLSLPERSRLAGDQWMERFSADPDRFRLTLEFGAYARRDPKLRESWAQRVGAVRTAVARHLGQEAERSGLDLPLSPEDLAAVVRALGIGLAMEKMNEPEAIRDELFGDFCFVLFALLAGENVEQLTGSAREPAGS